MSDRRNLSVAFVSMLAMLAMLGGVSLSGRVATAGMLRPHERIDKAIDALDKANEELDKAEDNFGGHKKEAMEKVRDAKLALVDSRDHAVGEAIHKVEEAQRQLRVCEEAGTGHHPRIHEAIDVLERAKEELK